MSGALFETDLTREQDRRTAEAFDDPRPGDEFHEMYSCWMIVLAVEPDGGKVTTLIAVGPGTVPGIGTVETWDTADDWREYYGGSRQHGYSMWLSRRDHLKVDGWLAHYPASKWVDKSAEARLREADRKFHADQRARTCSSCGQVKP